LTNETEPSIRRAGPDDAATLAVLGARTFSETFGHIYPPQDLSYFLTQAYSAEAVAADLADPAKAMWVVEAGDEAVGYALAGPCALPHPEVTPACGELKRFYLLKAWQGGGIGSRLLAAVFGWLEREGPRTLWIGVYSDNVGAQRLYARQGFERVGEYFFEVGQTRDHEFILRRSRQAAGGLT
jgi:ribosomal protein S18 acetylase RimI-like enzyme